MKRDVYKINADTPSDLRTQVTESTEADGRILRTFTVNCNKFVTSV